MRYVFLTSSPTGPLDGSRPVYGLDEMNAFPHRLKMCWKENSRVLMIAAFPDAHGANDQMCDFFREAFRRSGLTLETFDLCDDRYLFTKEQMHGYDCIVLSGGHVPTENRWFQSISLKEKLQDYQGIVIGISAGSMNAAEHVYVQPEETGESSVSFARDANGLGLCNVNILPHYQMVKHHWLDGRRLFEDITYADSFGRRLLCLEDGSYVLVHGERTLVYGRAWLIADGQLYFLQDTDQVMEWK